MPSGPCGPPFPFAPRGQENQRLPLVVVADPGLRVFHREVHERGVVGPVVVLAQAGEVVVARLANVIAHAVVKPCDAAQDEPAVAGPPRRGLEALVGQQLLPHVLGGGRAEPQLAVLLGGEAERAHVRLVVHARGEVPRGHAGEVLEDGLVSGHGVLLFHGRWSVFAFRARSPGTVFGIVVVRSVAGGLGAIREGPRRGRGGGQGSMFAKPTHTASAASIPAATPSRADSLSGCRRVRPSPPW